MKLNKLIDKIKNSYNKEWIIFVIKIFNNSKCSIELIDFLKNSSLTEVIYNNLEFIEENNIIYLSYKKIYNTPLNTDNLILKDNYNLLDSINIAAIHNPNFGKKYLIKYLDTLNYTNFRTYLMVEYQNILIYINH